MLAAIVSDLEAFIAEYAKRYKEQPDPFVLLDANPSKASAFFETLTEPLSLEMRILVWQILLGAEITKIHFEYGRTESFDLGIEILSPDGVSKEEFCSNRVWDFAVLRHMGVLTVDNKPIIEGYYASRR